jgi:prophage tail gpP-like protein
MPSKNPQEVATIGSNGLTYGGWQSVEISRRYGNSISHMTLEIAENSGGSPGGAAVKLMPNDVAQGFLGGKLAISGKVTVRQVSYDKAQHSTRIVVSSNTEVANASTVDGAPGFYQNYTLDQIAQAVLGKVGVRFQIVGAPPGADKIFPRVSEHIGETRFDFIERLLDARNLYVRDDGNGTLVATRGVGGTVAALNEGGPNGNILAASLTLNIIDYGNPGRTVGDNIGGSSTGIIDDNACRDVSASCTSPNMPANRPQTVTMPQPGDNQDAMMYLARVAAWNLAQFIEGVITVPGWFIDSGDLWLDQLGSLVTINSPMLVPGGQIVLALKGVISLQNDEDGTISKLEVCDPGSLGALGQGRSDGGLNIPLIGLPQPGG